jgi:hypothetical protein
MAPIFPLMMIMGFMGFKTYRRDRNGRLLLFVAIFFSLTLLTIPLDKRLGGIDTLSTIFLLSPKKAADMGFLPFTVPLLVFKVFIIFSPLLFFLFKRFLNWNSFLIFLFTFFSLNLIVTTIAVRQGSIDSKDFMEFAFWMEDNLEQDTVLIDIQDPKEQGDYFWMAEALKFWTDFIILEEAYPAEKSYEYVISKQVLPLTLTNKLEATEGIYETKSIELFLYENNQ